MYLSELYVFRVFIKSNVVRGQFSLFLSAQPERDVLRLVDI